MLYSVRHVTKYVYGRPVDLGAHLLHLRPRPLPGQRVLGCTIEAQPGFARTLEAVDYFGNPVSWMFLDAPHAAFSVTMEALVDVSFAMPPRAAATMGWEDVSQAAFAGGEAGMEGAEFLFESPMLAASPEARIYAAASFPAGRAVLEGLLDLNARIRRDFTFKAGVTTLHTPVAQVLTQRAGVCQDFSNLMIAGLRGLGLPARYVSGYIRTRPPPGQTRRRGADQSHAWVGCWLGPEDGWVGLDPTNGLIVHEEHVVLGYGRDYSDVSPVRGVILGGGTHAVSVSVDLAPALASSEV